MGCCGPVRSSRTVPGKEIPESGQAAGCLPEQPFAHENGAGPGQLWGPHILCCSGKILMLQRPRERERLFRLITETKAEENVKRKEDFFS
jgi:hypothetical protein